LVVQFFERGGEGIRHLNLESVRKEVKNMKLKLKAILFILRTRVKKIFGKRP